MSGVSRRSTLSILLLAIFASRISFAESGFGIRDRDGRVVIMWHPMKTGGTTLCRMAEQNEFSKRHIEQFGFDDGTNCKMGPTEQKWLESNRSMKQYCPTVGHKILDTIRTVLSSFRTQKSSRNLRLDGTAYICSISFQAAESLYSYYMFFHPVEKAGIDQIKPFFGRTLIAYEPSFPIGEGWSKFNPHALLRNADVWENFYHVFVVRHPVDRIISHIFFEKQWWAGCIHRRESTIDNMEDLIIALTENRCRELCPDVDCANLHGQITDFYVKHLSGAPVNLTFAVENLLHHVDHTIDITAYKEKGIQTCLHGLGWKNITVPHARVSSDKVRKVTYQEQFPRMYNHLLEHVRDDMVIYDLALEKERRWHESQGRSWDEDDEETLKRRAKLWDKWTKIVK